MAPHPFVFFICSFFVGLAVTIAANWQYVRSTLRLLQLLIRVKSFGRKNAGSSNTMADYFESRCDANPNRVQIISADSGEQRTLKQMDSLANQFARYAQKQGSKQMDTLAVMMLNSVDYPSFWLGMTKIGCSSALVNTNLSGKPFLHSVETALASSACKMVLVDYDLVKKLQEDIDDLISKGIKVLVWKNSFKDGDENLLDKRSPIINKDVVAMSTDRLTKDARNQTKESDPAIFIFTSGTTGLPKACKISHSRYEMACFLFPTLSALTDKDRFYVPLPLYHSAAGMLALGACFSTGACLVTRQKFSASNFSSDCLKYKVTVFQYIGELCRYLVTAPKNPLDEQVKLRAAIGNGMRKEYWTQFVERYHVTDIIEFYAATEGNVTLSNSTGHVGALGYIPTPLLKLYPIAIIRVDPDDNSKPLRNAQGKLERCKYGEPGLLISRIKTGPGNKDIGRRFDGYTDKKATNDKILTNVFEKDDMYFNTGDLLSQDKHGFFYWCDRTGDTFRWKGENCSTTEVSEVLSPCSTVHDIVVYGVDVPNTDGRAGMAAIVTSNENNTLNFDEIVTAASKNLPVYARPLFIRIKKDRVLPVTTTHKYIKADLVKQVRRLC